MPHSRNRPTTNKWLWPLLQYYQKPGNEMGGSLHIVAEDSNLNRSDVLWCLHDAINKQDIDGARIAYAMSQMSRTQRSKLVRKLLETSD